MEALREKMETCCRDLRGAPLRVRRLIGLQRVTPVAIEVPAWYFRLEEAPGAYLLECVGAGELGGKGSVSLAGNFTVRFFPTPGVTPVVLTRKECILRRSRAFGGDGFPRPEYLELIRRRNYFAAGDISIIFPPRGGALFHLNEDDRSGAGSDLFHTLVRMFVFHLRSIPAVWTAGTGWQAISFLPAPHLNGGAVRQPLPVWQELLRVSTREAGEESHGCRTASLC